MDNTDKYNMLSEGETGVPSNIGVVPSGLPAPISSDSIQQSLSNSKDFKLLSFDEDEDDTFLVSIDYRGERVSLEIYIDPMSRIDLKEFGFANHISDDELSEALKQKCFIEVSMFFGEDILDSFHLQLKILNTLIPEACVIIDFMSYRLLSGQWLRMVAASPIPPSPSYLYSIHGVYDDKGVQTRYWLHTHGLLRCRSVEFEVLNITDGAQQMNDIIVHVVKKIIKDPLKEYEKFQIGYDGMGINLAWIRWEEALKDFSADILGGMNDRRGENKVHADPSGILFAVEDGQFVSPQIYAKTLSENPIYYISNEETSRMSNQAQERFFCFRDSFNKHGVVSQNDGHHIATAKSQSEPGWRFLVKLGLKVDNIKAETEKEHLWFDVVSIGDNYIEGKLLNQPYWISGLNEGDNNRYPVELLTDWIIYSPDNTYTTDSIYELGYYK